MMKQALQWLMAAALATSVAGGTSARAEEPKKDPADDGLVQKMAHGEINWSKKTITATGSGAAKVADGNVAQARLKAERAAKLEAIRNILETVRGMQVSAQRTAGDMMSNGDINTKVNGLAQGFRIVDTKYYTDGSVDVIVSMPIDQSLTNALIGAPAGKAAKALKTDGVLSVTGLVINARGLGLVPSMSPRVVDETGAEVYGVSVVSEKGLAKGGIATYVRGDTTTQGGASPLAMKALRLADKTKTDLVISNADADKLRAQNLNLSFLAEGSVIILVD
jgi:hypothetical protein